MAERKDKSPNEVLVQNLPSIATELDDLWACHGNRSIGFAGGGNLLGNAQPNELSIMWSTKVNQLLEGCEADISDRSDEKDWGEMVVSLSDLADELNFYFSPLWGEVTNEERSRTEIRMDMNAQRLLKLFRKRGYIKPKDNPFKERY